MGRVPVLQDEEGSLEMGGGDGSTAMPMYLMPLNYMPKMVNIVLCVFYHNF